MEQINAPYNFVPLSDTVVTPDWGHLVSHDLPFKDGISGELELTIEALSPIMIGGDQKQGNEREAGQVEFFKTLKSKEHPEGQYAIPGSSLRGAIRNVFEIATFSRMSGIDDRRYGLRDISTRNVSDSYTERVRGNVKYGFMTLENGEPCIQPCTMHRLSHRVLERELGVKAPIFRTRMAVGEKYAHWEKLCREKGLSSATEVSFDHDNQDVTKLDKSGQSGITGFPVFTGQISDSTMVRGRTKGKYKDFMFHTAEAEKIVVSEVDPNAWGNFLFVHGDDGGNNNMSWPGYWKSIYRQGKKVPVFYVQGKDRLHIGLAYMPKLSGDFSTHDMLKHTSPDQLAVDKFDFTSLVFGQVGDKPEQSLKGRVSFEPALLTSKPDVKSHPKATVLNAPKPSYFPNYIYQQTKQSDVLAGGQFATYVHSDSNPAPELRGWKRYPVRPATEVATQPLGTKQSTKVQTRLYALEAGAVFKARMVFHNLRPEELGALLWSVEIDNKRHSLGMGKSFGYGQVKVTANWEAGEIRCNDTSKAAESDAKSYVEKFKSYMASQLKTEWSESLPVSALVAMSDVEKRDLFHGELEHMELDKKEFTTAKQRGFVLQSYVNDERKLKLRSHVVVSEKAGLKGGTELAEAESEVWEGAKIHFLPGRNLLTASKVDSAILEGDSAKAIFDGLSASAKKKVKKGLLVRSVSVKRRGNECIIESLNDS